jgi:hypothetical protein
MCGPDILEYPEADARSCQFFEEIVNKEYKEEE